MLEGAGGGAPQARMLRGEELQGPAGWERRGICLEWVLPGLGAPSPVVACPPGLGLLQAAGLWMLLVTVGSCRLVKLGKCDVFGRGLWVRVLAETADSEARTCLGSHSEDCCWMNLLGQMCSQVFGKASSHCSGSVHAWPSSVIFMACSNSPLLWFSNRQWLVGFRGQTCCTGGCTSRWRAQSFASAFKVPCYVICAVLKLLDLC